MKIIRLFRTASSEANFLLLASLIILLVKVLILNKIPPVFPGVHTAGLLVEAILASVIASYVFYFIVVHVKEQSNIDILRPYIEKHAKRVVGDCIAQIDAISKSSCTNLSLSSVTKSEIDIAFSKIAPYSPAPLVLLPLKENADWFQYFEYSEERTKSSIQKLLTQLMYLDPKLVSIITAIDDCSHYGAYKHLRIMRTNNSSLETWSSTFYDYCILCRELNNYLVSLGFSSAIS